MEVIRIPEVSLVDISGKNLGLYKDKHDWWPRVQIDECQNRKILQLATIFLKEKRIPSRPITDLQKKARFI